MNLFRRISGSLLASLGFVLSPLSWWNDLFVNLPLAYAAGVVASLLHQQWFLPGMIAGYWLSNVLGLLLMHFGVKFGWSKKGKAITRRDLVWDLLFSIAYTILIVILVKFGWLAYPESQFRKLIE